MRFDPEATVVTCENASIADLGDAFAILNLASGEYFDVAGSARTVVDMLRSGPITVAEIQDRLLAQYAVPAEQCAADLQAFLEELEQAGIVRVATV